MKKNTNEKRITRYLMEDLDQNWFSFFSGILANIPISILLATQKYGKTTWEHLFFFLSICVFLMSCVTVWFAFQITVIKIQIENQSEMDYEKWVQLNKTTSKKAKQDCIESVFKMKEQSVKRKLVFFCVFCGITFIAIVGLWILNNFI